MPYEVPKMIYDVFYGGVTRQGTLVNGCAKSLPVIVRVANAAFSCGQRSMAHLSESVIARGRIPMLLVFLGAPCVAS